MSKENVKLFLEKLQGDEQLQAKLGDLVAENLESIEGRIIQLAAEQGFEFNVADMQQLANEGIPAAQENGELDESQLEAVSGGYGGGYAGGHLRAVLTVIDDQDMRNRLTVVDDQRIKVSVNIACTFDKL